MIKPFDTNVTIDGVTYDIVIEGNDICLQSITQDIVLTGAKDDLMEICEKELSRSYFENGWPAPYTRAMVEDLFTEIMAEYAYDHHTEGEILNHNLN